jgi:transcriptional antiterminator RfaH
MSQNNEKNQKWYLVYTKARQENTAKINLENQGFLAYLPRISILDKNQNHIPKVEAMFLRYLFIKFNFQTDDWSKIKSTKGVSHLVIFGKKLATVDKGIIEFFQKNSDAEDIFHQHLQFSNYSAGDKIRIKNGILKGKEAIFLSDDGKKRARILLDIMNSRVVTDLTKEEIGEKADIYLDYIM